MTGIEKALRQIIEDETPMVRGMVKGEIPANPLYVVRALDDLHRLKAAADKVQLQELKALAEAESWVAA